MNNHSTLRYKRRFASKGTANRNKYSLNEIEMKIGQRLKTLMNNEDNRLLTFQNLWISKGCTNKGFKWNISHYSLACHGFFCYEEGQICCNFCGIEFSHIQLEPFADIATIHILNSPNCPIIERPRDCGNIISFSDDTLEYELKRAQYPEFQIARIRRSQTLQEGNYRDGGNNYNSESVINVINGNRCDAYLAMKKSEHEILLHDEHNDKFFCGQDVNNPKNFLLMPYHHPSIVKNTHEIMNMVLKHGLPPLKTRARYLKQQN